MMDPPEHDRLRALVSRVFTPKAVTALEPMIREVICSFLDPLDDATEFDAVADFSANFPVEIIARMLGMPEADRQPFRERLDISLHREHGQLDRCRRRTWRPSSRPARTSTSSRSRSGRTRATT